MGLLLINGCSHAAGSEIEYTNQPTCYEKSWGKWLSDMNGYDYINISVPGSGNESINRRTQNWITENVLLNKTYKKEDLHVIVMWSGFDRHEVYFPDTNFVDNINPMSDSKLHNTKMKFEIEKLKEVNVYFHDELHVNLKNLMILNNLLFFLNTYEIKYTYLNALHPFITLDVLNITYKWHALKQSYFNNLWIFNKINKHKHLGIFNENETFFHHLNNHPDFEWSKFSEKGHFGEDGHKYWAKKVSDFIFGKNEIVIKKLI